MTGEERMNRREEVREVGEEVKLRMMVRRRDAGFSLRASGVSIQASSVAVA